jgi:hypothetical protein
LSAAAVAAGTGLAGVLAVATPITAGVAAIVGLLSAMGVFDNKDAEKQQEQLGIDYNSLSFVMQKWYNGYAKALSKLDAIDAIEFKQYLAKKYGNDFVNTPPATTTGATLTDTVKGLFSNFYTYVLLALIAIYIIYTQNKKNGKRKR